MYCKICFEFVSGDCLLTNGECVFCFYKTNSWDSNGKLITKKESLKHARNLFISMQVECKKYFRDINKEIEKLPKGTIIQKKIKNHKYFYLQERIGKKIIYKYFGKNRPEELIKLIERRQTLINKRNELSSLFYALNLINRPNKKINRWAILNKFGFRCQYCGKTPADGVKLEIDHIIPLKKAGSNKEENFTVSCDKCNIEKSSKLLESI